MSYVLTGGEVRSEETQVQKDRDTQQQRLFCRRRGLHMSVPRSTTHCAHHLSHTQRNKYDIKCTYVTSQLFFRRRLPQPARAHHISPTHSCGSRNLSLDSRRRRRRLGASWGVSSPTCSNKKEKRRRAQSGTSWDLHKVGFSS